MIESTIDKIKSFFIYESPGFKSGREAYRYWATEARACSSNPFDPSDTNYDDYWDGIVYEKDLTKNRRK